MPRSHALNLPLYTNDDEVLTFGQWCTLNTISPRNGRRIIKSPDGPDVVQLSEQRIGITRRANRIWQARRSRPRVQHAGIEAA
jgi:hypothetical protein